MTDQISFQIKISLSYEEAIEKVTSALKEEGFGVLTSINVKDTLKEKIDIDFRQYTILGACNPPLAHQALSTNPLVGLMLPCNVTVEETDDGGSLVNFVNPKAMLLSFPGFAKDESLVDVAHQAYEKFERVAGTLGK